MNENVARTTEPMRCTKCGSDDTWRHEVDIGVGTQMGPLNCNVCGYSEAEPCPQCGEILVCRDDCSRMAEEDTPW